ncbi:MFS transporter [Natronoglycomyces albus]|uniref:MFS transporter n=1 Tax=Natronoglycomyces albus TaxID=2811108 RepID=A0A895XJ45_9ACTN|nr:MFS transporter [Natronoglycomyces albus]QSB04997.1 MFS transporter [Natronoglycomyces albus]
MSDVNLATGHTAGRREWMGLALLILPSMLLFMMLTILFLAAPHMAADLHPSSTQLLWILDIYGFLMAGFLVAMGVLGDKVGRRMLLMAGAAVFGLVSVLAAFTNDPSMMILWRAVLGIAAAAQMPATLGLIFAMFNDVKQRGVAIGLWAAGISAGVALGPLLSGVLLELFSWRSTFLVAVPVMALVFIAAPLLLPEHRDPNAGKLDVMSAAILLATLLPAIYGVKRLAGDGSVAIAAAAIAMGVAFGIWFVARQLRLPAPLLDVRLFANPTVSGALSVFILSAAALGGVYFLLTQHLQLVMGLSPLQTGLAILPAALLLIVVAVSSPMLARRVRPGNVIATGLAVQVIGYLLLTQVNSTSGLPLVLAGFIILYPAVAPSMALTTDLVVGSVKPEKAGAASGLATTANDLGISLGVAVVGSIGVAAYRSEIADTLPSETPAQVRAAAEDSLDGAIAGAGQVSADISVSLLEAARAAFASGLNVASAVAAGIAVVASIIAATRLRHIPPTGSVAREETELTSAPGNQNS